MWHRFPRGAAGLGLECRSQLLGGLSETSLTHCSPSIFSRRGAGVQGSPRSAGVSMGLDLIVHFESPGTGFIIFHRGYQNLELRAMQEINNRQIYYIGMPIC